ncbi:MAG: hypothetical protein AABX17_03755 [Nanoarchaeota archaeon]
MTLRLEDDIASGGYRGQVYLGYFHLKNAPNSSRNGHGKSRLPYQIRHIHPGSNPQVTMASIEILEHKNEQFYFFKRIENFLSSHLKDPRFELSKQEKSKNASVDPVGLVLEVEVQVQA